MRRPRARRFILLAIALVVALAAALAYLATTEGDGPAVQREGPVAVIGHRGASGHAPENTLESFRRALELGADAIEFDLQTTADGHVVVLHDSRVDRTTDGSGRAADMTLAEIQALDAGHHFPGPQGDFPFRRQGVRIPTLVEVLEAFPTTPIIMEMKRGGGPGIVEATAAIVQRHGAQDRVIVGSFDRAFMRRFREILPAAETSFASDEVRNLFLLHLVGLDRWYRPPARYLAIPEHASGLRIVRPSFLRAARRLGLEVHVWTVNDPADMRRLAGLGVDGILTDYPDRLVDALAGP